MLFCSRCPIQLVGEMGLSLLTRMGQHRLDICSGKDADSPVVQHFLLHGLDALRAAGLQRNTIWTPEQRRASERHWLGLLDAGTVRPW